MRATFVPVLLLLAGCGGARPSCPPIGVELRLPGARGPDAEAVLRRELGEIRGGPLAWTDLAERLPRAGTAVLDDYVARGYWDARTEAPVLELSADRRRVTITVPVSEGARYRVGALAFRDAERPDGVLGESEARAALRSGDWALDSQLAAAGDALRRAYGERGHAHCDVQVIPHRREGTLDVTFEVTAGPAYVIDAVDELGEQGPIPLEAPLASIPLGELYVRSRIDRVQQELEALHPGMRVSLRVEPLGDEPDHALLRALVWTPR